MTLRRKLLRVRAAAARANANLKRLVSEATGRDDLASWLIRNSIGTPLTLAWRLVAEVRSPMAFLRKLRDYLVLPPEVSPFERDYLAVTNGLAMAFFFLHPPFIVAAAYSSGYPWYFALPLALLVVAAPAAAIRKLSSPRHISLVHAVIAALMGALLLHVTHGTATAEAQIYVFVLLSLLAVMSNPLVVLVGAAGALLLGMPSLFVFIQAGAAVFVARSFFDHVIGLEKIVAALNRRTEDMKRLLDHAEQGFLTLDRTMVPSAERSAAVEEWFGGIAPGERWADVLARHDGDAGAWFEVGFDELLEGLMPAEVVVAQLPRRLQLDERHLAFDYQVLLDEDGGVGGLFVVIDDVTLAMEAEVAEAWQHETTQVIVKIVADRGGFAEFFEEASDLVRALVHGTDDPALERRWLHTLKGNCAVFGLATVSTACHNLESSVIAGERLLSEEERERLADVWVDVVERFGGMVDDLHDTLDVSLEEQEALVQAIARRSPRLDLIAQVARWRQEPMRRRLDRIREQVERLAERLGKEPLEVELRHGDLRLPRETFAPFWTTLVHVVRNAIDHGLEDPDERAAAGKGPGTIRLATYHEGHDVVVAIGDDGRGIDWDAVARKAAAAGLSHGSHEARVEALFADGLSTKETATATSGRGVGMGAVRAAVHDLGGQIEVEAEPGAGTTFRFRFPRELVDAELELLRTSVAQVSLLTPSTAAPRSRPPQPRTESPAQPSSG